MCAIFTTKAYPFPMFLFSLSRGPLPNKWPLPFLQFNLRPSRAEDAAHGILSLSLSSPSRHRHLQEQSLPMRFQAKSHCFFLLCIVLIYSFQVSARQCLANQSSLLLQLKQGFSVPLGRLGNWLAGSDCCLWEGVTCDNATGSVIGLDLSSSSQKPLSGQIHPRLFNLSSLRSLNLSYNNFTQSPIPLGLGQMKSLTHLNLSNAGFYGQIPLEISRLSRLVSLDLSTSFPNLRPSTSFKLENPDLKAFLQNLTALQQLYLDGVDISASGTEWSKSIPSSLSDLRELSLSSCLLSGPIDPSLLSLPSLTKLHLERNNLSFLAKDSFSNFASMKLKCLHLYSCRLRGQLPENIFQLPDLHTLDASYNPFLSGSLPSFLHKNWSFRILRLSETNLSGTLPETFGNLPFLNRLELYNCSFHGPIPPSLGNLTELVTLDLSFNKFSGQIPSLASRHIAEIDLSYNCLAGALPPSLGSLLNITLLNLKNNRLNRTIPSSLLNLQSLQSLDLSQNMLSGFLPEFTNRFPSQLETLDLSNNKLKGSIPRSITNLTQLKVLVLSSNELNGTFDLGLFKNLKNLSSLDLSDNGLTVVFSNAWNRIPQITRLKLGSCNISEFPSFLKSQTRLSYLDLSNNSLRGDIPNWIWQVGNGQMTYLNLSRNQLTGIQEPANLSSSPLAILDLHFNMLQGSLPLPPYATVLDYSINNFSSRIPTDIDRYLNVTYFFSLSGNRFTGEIPPSICNGAYLNVLDISKNSLTGLIPRCLANFSVPLSVLNLRGNKLQGNIPDGFTEGSNLRTLDLNSNRLTGPIPRSLVNCTFLEVLDLGNNNLTGTFPSWLENLHQLRVLVLRSNQFHGSIEPSRTEMDFEALQIIDLSSNKFTGNLPARYLPRLEAMIIEPRSEEEKLERQRHHSEFLRFRFLDLSMLYYQDMVMVTLKGREMQFLKILTIFTSIDLSNNDFQGIIPEELGKLNSLYVLNISHNNLSGQIPASLGNLSRLESMDLSNNKLMGQIPAQLTELNFLSVLDLSHNLLTGKIPKGSQFSTFSNVSFQDNPGLCGFPLSLPCLPIPAEPTNDKPTTLSDMGSGDVANWQFIMAGVGFGGGMAVVLGPLLFWTEGRRWFNGYSDVLLLLFLPAFGLLYDNVRVEAEERVADIGAVVDDGEDDEDDEEEEAACDRRFCVFCTQLDVVGSTAIHKSCSCHDSEPSTVAPFEIQS